MDATKIFEGAVDNWKCLPGTLSEDWYFAGGGLRRKALWSWTTGKEFFNLANQVKEYIFSIISHTEGLFHEEKSWVICCIMRT